MSRPLTTALYNQSAGGYEVLHAADLDVWVAYDGGAIIVMQGAGTGHSGDTDANSGDLRTPAGASHADETMTVITVPAVTIDGADGNPTVIPVLPTSPRPTQSPVELSTISPSAELPTLMSATQAPSTQSLFPTSETPATTLSNMMTPSLTSEPVSVATTSMSASPSISAVVPTEPATTIAARPAPTPSDYLSHSPPHYVAIILGSIAGVTTLAALIAWAFRRQAHAKRRRLADSAAKLPWVYYSTGGNDDNGSTGPPVAPDIENAMQNTNTETGIMNLGSREDMACVQAWEPRGDRDVGEPKRSESCVDRKPRPPFIAQQIPSCELFSRYSGREFMSNRTASPCVNRISLGSIDPHIQVETLGRGSPLLITNQVPGDISTCSSQEDGLPCPAHGSLSPHSEIGTPRELVPMPRFLGLDGEGLNIPWEEKTLSSNEGLAETKTRSRIMSAEHIRKTWDRSAPNPVEDPFLAVSETTNREPEGEGWANSIKSNVVNAFNAVAATLPMAAAIKEGKMDPDRLTPARPKRSSKRGGLLRYSSSNSNKPNLSTSLDRKGTIISLASDPWSLVETGSNNGIVHVHLPASDTCSNLSHETSGSGLAVSDSVLDTILRSYEPLHIKKKLSTTPLSKRRSSVLSKDSRSRITASRSSSAIGSVSPKRHRKTTSCSSIKRKVTIDRRSSPLYSRTTSLASVSSATSALSIVTGTDGIVRTRSPAREALKNRRRKAKRLKEVSITLE